MIARRSGGTRTTADRQLHVALGERILGVLAGAARPHGGHTFYDRNQVQYIYIISKYIPRILYKTYPHLFGPDCS